jgi:hypothetical protein
MSHAAAAALTGLLIVGAAVWIGGQVALVVVARVATRTLPRPARIAFFRLLGRVYAVVGTAALVLAYGTGAALLYGRPWTGALIATVAVAVALAVVTGIGMVQARRMGRLRRRAVESAGDEALAARVRRGAVRAGVLRGLIVVLSFALLALGVLLGG